MATDAMGANDEAGGDSGGFGVVAGDVPQELALDCLKTGVRPGKALQRDLQLGLLVEQEDEAREGDAPLHVQDAVPPVQRI